MEPVATNLAPERKPRRIWMLAPSLGILVLLLLPLLLGDQRPGVGAQAQLQGNRWVVTVLDRGGVADLADVRAGDTILRLDGQAPRDRHPVDPWLQIDSAREWTIARHGAVLQRRTTAPENDLGSLLLLLTALGFWSIAAFTRWSKPNDPLVTRLYWLNMAMAGALTLNVPAGLGVAWADVLEVASFAALPALFLSSFIWLATGERPRGRAGVLTRALGFLGGAVGLLYVVSGVAGAAWYGALGDVLLALLVAGFLGGLASMAHAYREPVGQSDRSDVGPVLLGVGAAVLPVTALSIVPVIVVGAPLVPPQVAALTTVFLPLSLMYAVVRHRLLGIEVVVGRTLVYGAMTALLTGCYALLLAVVSRSNFGHAIPNLAVSSAFFAAVTLSFAFIRDRLHGLVDHLIYRDRYDYVRTLRLLGSQLTSVQPLDHALSEVVDRVSAAMDLDGAAILLREADGSFGVRAANGAYRDPRAQANLVQIVIHPPEDPHEAQHRVPLMANGEECGTIYLGWKRAHLALSRADLSFAQTIAHQAAPVVANAILVDRLRSKVTELEVMRDRLMHVGEEERKQVAQDLHDGALQSLLEMGRQIDALGTALESAQAPVLVTRIWHLVELGRAAAYELRAVCSDLYPSELTDLGLVPALQDLARTTSRDEAVEVQFVQDGFPTDGRLCAETEEALYRIAREAVTNVVRHAGASRACLRLACREGGVSLTVRDDGTGFVVPLSSAGLVRTGHIGIVTMRERMERAGGHLTVNSAYGEGTEVRADLPDATLVRNSFDLVGTERLGAHANPAGG